jgi:hypothetical protein
VPRIGESPWYWVEPAAEPADQPECLARCASDSASGQVLDVAELAEAQTRQDAIAAQRVVRRAMLRRLTF